MRGFVIGLLVLILLLLALPALAQEATPDAPVIVSIEQPDDTVSVPADTFINSQNVGLWIGLAGGVLIAIAGGGTFAMVLNRLSRSDKDNLERAHESLSPTWQTMITRMIDIADTIISNAQVGVQVARTVTDGKPNTDDDVLSLTLDVPDGMTVSDYDKRQIQVLVRDYFENRPPF